MLEPHPAARRPCVLGLAPGWHRAGRRHHLERAGQEKLQVSTSRDAPALILEHSQRSDTTMPEFPICRGGLHLFLARGPHTGAGTGAANLRHARVTQTQGQSPRTSTQAAAEPRAPHAQRPATHCNGPDPMISPNLRSPGVPITASVALMPPPIPDPRIPV